MLKPFVVLIATIAATAGLLFGFDTGNIAGALIFIQKEFHTTTLQNEMIVSATVLGAFMSALLASRLLDIYGRRNMLLFAAIVFMIGAVWGAWTHHIASLIFARLLLGIAIGISSFAAPLYISEISPPHYRGRLVLINGIAITSGEAIAYLIDYFLASGENWRMMIFLGFIPGLILFLGMLYMPCSPRWLLLKNKKDQALAVLKKIIHPNQIIHEMNSILQAAQQPNPTWNELFGKKIRRLWIIGIGLGILQQFFGINALFYYGPFIFEKAGFNGHSSQILATFGLGLMNVVMTILTGYIVDKIGRRFLLLTGSLVAALSLSIISLIFHSPFLSGWKSTLLLICFMTYIIGYCISVGSLFWLIIAEIFPLAIRGIAMGIATSIQWLANFIVSISFLSLLHKLGPSITFTNYSIVCLLSFIFVYFLVPETKGLSLEKIEQKFSTAIP